jgi:hypothetical protein
VTAMEGAVRRQAAAAEARSGARRSRCSHARRLQPAAEVLVVRVATRRGGIRACRFAPPALHSPRDAQAEICSAAAVPSRSCAAAPKNSQRRAAILSALIIPASLCLVSRSSL